jgi:hypothetical protein
MSKKEMINTLIDAGNSFEKIVELSKAKASYVKSCFTRKGFDWHDYTDEELGEQQQIIDLTEEVEVLTEEVEDLQVDIAAALEAKKEIVPKPELEPESKPKGDHQWLDCPEITAEAQALLVKANQAPAGKMFKIRTKGFRSLSNQVLVMQDFAAVRMNQMSASYRGISPRPTNSNSHKEVYELHIKMKELFREARK